MEPGTHTQNKTEQRVLSAIETLKSATEPMSYEELRIASGGAYQESGMISGGTSYDVLLYLTTTLVVLGLVEKTQVVEGPGRPRAYFQWINS